MCLNKIDISIKSGNGIGYKVVEKWKMSDKQLTTGVIGYPLNRNGKWQIDTNDESIYNAVLGQYYTAGFHIFTSLIDAINYSYECKKIHELYINYNPIIIQVKYSNVVASGYQIISNRLPFLFKFFFRLIFRFKFKSKVVVARKIKIDKVLGTVDFILNKK